MVSQPHSGESTEKLIVVCNVGSSSLKIKSFRAGERRETTSVTLEGKEAELFNGFADLVSTLPGEITFLHRVVHAGHVTQDIEPVTESVLEAIRHWSHLAPQHNRLVLKIIDWLNTRSPDLLQYAVYDSGLYRDLPRHARIYALPPDLDPAWPVMRYGFHGLAHRSQWNQIPGSKKERIITVQLGSGCSVTAWKAGKAVDTTMGFTPLDGLAMATRSGSVDPNILLHLLRQGRHTVDSLSSLLQRDSGLLGISQLSGDMRRLVESDSAEAALAIDYFCYQVKKQIGAYGFALGGIDAISFGGGIGENQPLIRQAVLQELEQFGIVLCPEKNRINQQLTALHAESSTVALLLTPVDEMAEMINLFTELPEACRTRPGT